MKSSKLRKTLFSAVGALFLMASVSYAMPPDDESGPGSREGKGRMEEHMRNTDKKLNLTPDQQTKLDEHRKTHREEAKKLFEQSKQKREDLKTELEKPEVDDAKVRAIHEEMKALQNKMADHRLNGILEVRRILTPEQFKKFQEFTRKSWKMNGKGHGNRHGKDHRSDASDEAPPPQ